MTEQEVRDLLCPGIKAGDRCHFCGARQPNSHFTVEDGKRYWEGWEIKNDAGVHLSYLPDMPERLCGCEGREK